jgi:hypothetical protein
MVWCMANTTYLLNLANELEHRAQFGDLRGYTVKQLRAAAANYRRLAEMSRR